MMTSAMRAFLLTLGALVALTVPVSAGAGATVSAAGVPKGSYQSSCTAIQRVLSAGGASGATSAARRAMCGSSAGP